MLFHSNFMSARLENGETVEFTTAESNLLGYLARHPKQILSRQQILDAMSKPGSDKSDRSIDHLINRVRSKLKDDVRDPKYIGTRYGGGYVWLADDQVVKEKADGTDDADFEVGPMRGLELLERGTDGAVAFVENLTAALRHHFETREMDELTSQSDAAAMSGTTPSKLLIELSFFNNHGKDECVVTCRTNDASRIIHTVRIDLINEAPPFARHRRMAAAIVEKIMVQRWKSSTVNYTAFSPLPIAMHEATLNRHHSKLAWEENEAQVGQLSLEHPDDPAIKLMRACHIHTGHVSMGYERYCSGDLDWTEEMAKIERLVLETLDFAQSKPELAIIAAKLLYYANQGYKSAVLDLARRAHGENTAIATSLTVLGQLEAFTGNTDHAIDLLSQAAVLCEPGTRFHVYVLTLHCQALVAASRRNEIVEALSQIYKTVPKAKPFYELLFTDPNKPSVYAKGIMLLMSKRKATALLRYTFQISGRLFVDPVHRENSIRTPLSLCVRRFGRDIIPPELINEFPGLLD